MSFSFPGVWKPLFCLCFSKIKQLVNSEESYERTKWCKTPQNNWIEGSARHWLFPPVKAHFLPSLRFTYLRWVFLREAWGVARGKMDSLFHVLVSTCLALTFSGKCLSPLLLGRVALSAAEQSPPAQLVTYKNRVTSSLGFIREERGAGQM